MTKTKNVAEVAAQVRRDLGEVEFLVNNAGVLMCKNILDLEEKDIRKTMEVNAISHFWVCFTLRKTIQLAYLSEKNITDLLVRHFKKIKL